MTTDMSKYKRNNHNLLNQVSSINEVETIKTDISKKIKEKKYTRKMTFAITQKQYDYLEQKSKETKILISTLIRDALNETLFKDIKEDV